MYCKTVANRADYEEEVASDPLTAALQLLPIFLRRQYFTFFTRLFVVLVLYSPYLNIEFHAFFFRQSNALIVWTFSDSWTSLLPQIQSNSSSFWVILSLWLSLGSFGCHLWLISEFRPRWRLGRDFKKAIYCLDSRNWGGYVHTYAEKATTCATRLSCFFISKTAIIIEKSKFSNHESVLTQTISAMIINLSVLNNENQHRH